MSCGAEEQHQVTCIDFMSLSGIDANTTSAWLVVRYSTSSVQWGFNDNQTMTAYGTLEYTWNFGFNTATASSTNVVVGDLGVSLPVIYGGGNTYGFGAVISGQYLGGTPEHVVYFTMPARPYSAPCSPGIGASNVTQNSAYITVTAPGCNGGAGIDAYETEVWVNGGGRVAIWAGGSGTATGLVPGTNYVARARARNAAGLWSEWSGWAYFTTVAGGRVKAGPTWVSAGAYIKAGPTWVRAQGVWKKAGNTWVK
jgi:hypothetical protein